MRHLKSFNPLNRTHSHRKALYRNMAEALFKNERIKTTKAKAKEIRRICEKLITRAKTKSLHNIRIVSRIIKNKDILMKLFDEIAPRYIDKNGGYTRIIKLQKRKGDGSDMAYLELIEEQVVSNKKKKKKKIDKEKLEKKVDIQEIVDENKVTKETEKDFDKQEDTNKESIQNNIVDENKNEEKEDVDSSNENKDDSK